MTISWNREIPRERTASGKFKDGTSYTRAFLVRTDDPTESLVDISNAPGIAFQDLHPDDDTANMESFSVKPADDSGLLYIVSFEYAKFNPNEQDPPEGEPGGMPYKPPIWGGSSSVNVEPIYKDNADDIMTNSAGDAIEGLQAERAEERLTLTQYYPSHNDWMQLSRDYTNAINDGAWNGGDARTWKCQGCSKKLNIETKDGATTVYWEINWEFAYKADKWTLKPWDIGFAELVDDDGNPSSSGTKRAQIKGQDGKGVRQPVALQNGMAKPAGEKPDALEFFVYPEKDFSTPFGQVFTPEPPPQ